METSVKEVEIVHALKEAVCLRLVNVMSDDELCVERQRLLQAYRDVIDARRQRGTNTVMSTSS